jgi:exopolysaccharide biosynthesis polyprenyl glycosylphosphotransferase
MITIGILFILKASITFSRLIIVLFAISIIVLSIIVRGVKQQVFKHLVVKGFFERNVLIVGAGQVGEQLKNFFSGNGKPGFKVAGFLDDYKQSDEVLGKIKDLESIIVKYNISDIYITIPSEKQLINSALKHIQKYDVSIKIIPEMYYLVSSTVKFNSDECLPYMELVRTPLRGINLIMKRIVDIALSLIGLVAVLPVFLIVALAIKIDSRGPVFFKQLRVGKNGSFFYMYKFRSMVANAEELKEKLFSINEATGPVFKIKKDPRVTRVGAFIRKYSIDELPQLINVLRGDMSLIGPRPPLPNEVEQYSDYHWRRLDVKPGITGLWQVSGRSNLSFDEWVNLDIYYIENWSISLDIKILLNTIPAVLKGQGAY